MQKLWQSIAEILLLSRLEKRWQKAAKFLTVIVVFCTTYMLILPAITMEKETYCGFEEHSHEESCYIIRSELSCPYEDIAELAYYEETTDEAEQITQEEETAETEHTTQQEETASEPEQITQQEEETSESERTVQEETTYEPEGVTRAEAEEETTDETEQSSEIIQEITAIPEQIHEHNEECYLYEKELVCTLDEHTHEDICLIEELAGKNTVNLMEDYPSDGADIAPMAENDAGVKIDFDSLDGSGKTSYIVYASYGGNYYAIDGNGNAVAVNVSNGVVTSPSMGSNILWTFTRQSNGAYRIINVGTNRCLHAYHNSNTNNGVTTGNSYDATLRTGGNGSDKYFTPFCNNKDYVQLTSSGNKVVFQHTFEQNSSVKFYLAEVRYYYVWLDGTCGGIMSLKDSDNTCVTVSGSSAMILPSTWKSPSKYDYVINGWYDIKNHKYYKPGEAVTVTGNTVFYADWVAATYDVGQNNEHVVPSLDTNSFIKTDMFDYSAIFNMMSVQHTGSVSATSHSETWSIVQNANVPYNNQRSLGFIFRDWDSANVHISYAANRANLNDNQGKIITSEITDYVYNMSGKNIIDILFNPGTQVIGKTHVGEANYLYQFMEEGSANYDGIHNGYYYYDATKNAASYNQSEQRFYVYDYLERTSDSEKDGDVNSSDTTSGAFSDFLPFNSPYANNSNNKDIEDYKDAYENYGNYQYDAKYDGQMSEKENAGTNYWFGMKSEIKFYLPNKTGEVDDYGNLGNISTHGEHMNFQFHGDDDLWVFIDGELVMDVGGLHGIMNGKIDFSTGMVTTDDAKNNASVDTTPKSKKIELDEGDHTLTLYYMERGGSQSNCAIYFNIAPRYAMEIMKKDIFTREDLNGAKFSVYTDALCTEEAVLWESEASYRNGDDPQNTFTVKNGKAYFWGIAAGKVYYIKETTPPNGYPLVDNIVRVAMNNIGDSVCTTDAILGADGKTTNGFTIIKSEADQSDQLLIVTLSNQKELTQTTGETGVKVTKQWPQGVQNIPKSIDVYLTVNGALTTQMVTLSDANDWTHIWYALPEYDDNGDEIDYGVREVQVPGYYSSISVSKFTSSSSQWEKAPTFKDGETFIIVNSATGDALAATNNRSFSWVTLENAKTNSNAQWKSVADGMGFYLENGNGRQIVLNDTLKFTPDTGNGNRVLYFFGSKLFSQRNNTYYYFSDTTGSSSAAGGLNFELYTRSVNVLDGDHYTITNKEIGEKPQTKITVTKKWEDDNLLHTNHKVRVHLYANGEETGRSVVLDAYNNWTDSFEGLLYCDDNQNIINYTVVEDRFPGYMPKYTVEHVPLWKTEDALTAGRIYRFVNSAGYALSSDSSGALMFAEDNPEDRYQQWEAVKSGSIIALRNVVNNRYLQYRSSTVSTINTLSTTYCSAQFKNNRLILRNSYYIYTGANTTTVSVISNQNQADLFTLSVKNTDSNAPYYNIEVENMLGTYVLPETGASGTQNLYIIGGLLITLSSVFLLCYIKKDRGRRRKCSRA